MDELMDVASTMSVSVSQQRRRKLSTLFMFADSDNDGHITLDEFINGVEGNKELIKLLNLGQELPVTDDDGKFVWH